MDVYSHENDINLGSGQWLIQGKAFDQTLASAEMDQHLQPIWPFFAHLVVNCVAACCGIDAFDFSPAVITRALAQSSPPDAQLWIDRLTQAQKAITIIPVAVVSSAKLNQYLRKEVFLALLSHIQQVLIYAQPE